MKKLTALFLALTMVFTMAVTASASETNQTPGSTTLTTTVPAATYTLNIPADTIIEFGKTITKLGNVTVTGASNFAKGKNLEVKVTYDAFMSDDSSITTTIPYVLKYSTFDGGAILSESPVKNSGETFVFHGLSDKTVTQQAVTAVDVNGAKTYVTQIGIAISSEDWGKALAGNYTSVISFTAEVVVE